VESLKEEERTKHRIKNNFVMCEGIEVKTKVTSIEIFSQTMMLQE